MNLLRYGRKGSFHSLRYIYFLSLICNSLSYAIDGRNSLHHLVSTSAHGMNIPFRTSVYSFRHFMAHLHLPQYNTSALHRNLIYLSTTVNVTFMVITYLDIII